MTPNTDRGLIVFAHRRAAVIVAVALMLGSVGFSGCGIVKAVKTVTHKVESDKSTMDAFTNKVKSGESVTFEATYVTTGSSPATIIYAVEPPTGLAFKLTSSGSTSSGNGVSSEDIIVNPSGEYSCSPPSTSGSGSSPATKCQKLPKANAATYNKILDLYTPAHWVKFLDDFALAAGFAGDTVSSSTLTVNGFNMTCVDFEAPGVAGMSTICTTAQDILGYVKVASSTTSFKITSYSASPAASLFKLPPGATVTTIPPVTTVTTTTS